MSGQAEFAESDIASFLAGGGETGTLIRSFDWAATALGPPRNWPQSLRSAISILLPSRAQICLFWGPDLIAIYNDAYRPTLGIKHPRALGQPARQVWREFWDDVLRPLLEGVRDTGEAFWASDYPFFLERHGYPEETYFDVSYDPVRDESGSVGGVFCIVSETTGRVVGERRLRILRDIGRLASEARNAEDAFRRVAEVISANPRDLPFALLFEQGGSGVRCVAACGIAAIDGSAWPLAQAAAQRREIFVPASELPTGIRLPGGEWPEPCRMAGVLPIAIAGEDPVGFLVAGIAPRRPLDDGYRDFLRLVASNIAAVIGAARALEEERKRAEALAEIDRAKTDFFSNISHEFRTPLTLMLGPIEDALNDPSAALPAAQRGRLELAHRNSLRLLRLVNTLLDFSRIEAGRADATYAPTDLAALTVDLVSGFRSAIDKAGLSLAIDCPSVPEPVYVDRDMWEKIVLNLLSNAFKFTFEGGISVALRSEPNEVVLSVADTGVGIPEHELPRLFERFHRIAGQKGRSFEGSGIGLALVQELVRLHGGTIEARSQLGSGTTFTVRIPRGNAHLPAARLGPPRNSAPPASHVGAFVEEALRWLPDLDAGALEIAGLSAPSDRSAAPEGRRPRVMLADDNADLREYVRRLLGARYEITTAADGQAALEQMRRLRPDLLLSDVMMPELDGIGLLRAVRDDPELRDIPVILLSARAGEEARAEGIEAGADDYLTKPFAARELLARVATNLALAQIRREATEAALDNAERLRQMFDQAPGFICILRGPDHVFDLANAAYVRLVGNRALIGRPVREAFPEMADQGYFDLLDEVYHTGRAFSGKSMPILLRQGSSGRVVELLLDFVYQPIRDRSGAVIGIFVEGFDVTERVRAENALRDMNETLETRVAQRTAELREALARLEAEMRERERAQDALRQAQKMEIVGQLTGGVAHDFNNLLTAISGGAELLQHLLPQSLIRDNARIRRALDMIDRGTQHAATLTDRLLTFARRQALAPRPLDVNELIAGMLDLLHRTLGESIEIDTTLAQGLWRTMADPNQLESALLNLAVNARDAMPRGGALGITTENASIPAPGPAPQRQDAPAGDYVIIAVADTGTGMTEDTLERVFEPFFTTKEPGYGTGLGLSQVYGFIRQSDGHVRISSAPGHGTVVRLYLPRLAHEMPEVAEVKTLPAAPAKGNGELILVVEDDEAVREYSTETLRELGYAVITAPNAPAGLQLLARHADVRLLFTDVGLPGGLSGRELAREARRQRPDLAVLFTTGYARSIIAPDGILDAGIHLLPKPFSRSALAAKIRDLLSRQVSLSSL